MRYKTKAEIDELVLKNKRLAYHISKNMHTNFDEKPDVQQIGLLGLIKAAKTFDDSQNITFGTYGSRCIYNEIFMYFRGEKKRKNDVSINTPIGTDGEGNEITLMDVISDPNADFEERVAQFDILKRAILLVLNALEGRERQVILYRMADMKQHEIAKIMGISRSYVSRFEKKAHKILRALAKKQHEFEEVFSMPAVGSIFPIVFSSSKVQKFNQIFSALLQKLTSSENIPDFKVNCNKDRIIIWLPDNPSSFAFLAKIINEIDNFSMKYEATDNDTKANNSATTSEKNGAVEIDVTQIQSEEKYHGDTKKKDEPKKEDKREEPAKEEESEKKEELEKKDETEISVKDQPSKDVSANEELNLQDDNSGKVENSLNDSSIQRARILDFMLILDVFTFKELRTYFPAVEFSIINYAIHIAVKKGLINRIERGKYQVVK
jgi:RNA polymerase sporulation-specific sigma factor